MKPAISALTPTSPTASDLRRWCIAKPNADVMVLQENLDYACGQGINCSPIQPGGACYYPDTVQAHAAYAMNEYYQASGRNTFDCDFGQSGMVMTTDPSKCIKIVCSFIDFTKITLSMASYSRKHFRRSSSWAKQILSHPV